MITGIGGTGVVTIGALLTMAAHLEGKAGSEMQMAGLAQKGGAVSIHCRLAPSPEAITAIRLSPGEADAIIGGDLVTTASPKVQALMERGRTGVLCNTAEITTGEFTRDTGFSLPMAAMRRAVEARVGEDRLRMIDATRLAERLTGDAIFANVLLLGAAWQAGLVPLSEAALLKAVELNGAAVEKNARAFALGRWAVACPDEARAAMTARRPRPRRALDAMIARRAAFLTGYQNARLARRYTRLVERARAMPAATRCAEAVAEGYFKLLSYKDEYEVARLHAETLETRARRKLRRRPPHPLSSRAADHRAPGRRGPTGQDRIRPLDADRLPPAANAARCCAARRSTPSAGRRAPGRAPRHPRL